MHEVSEEVSPKTFWQNAGEFFKMLFGFLIMGLLIFAGLKWGGSEVDFDDETQVVTVNEISFWGLREKSTHYKLLREMWSRKTKDGWVLVNDNESTPEGDSLPTPEG